MALFCAAGSLLALKITSLTPAASAAFWAPSFIWVKNKACWLICTSAIVGLSWAWLAPTDSAKAAPAADSIIVLRVMFSIFQSPCTRR